jgi:tetratricopeptide (TPR) repeat protein
MKTTVRRPRRSRAVRLTLAALAALYLSAAARGAESARPPAPLFKDIGRHHHPVTTASKLAQRHFDQGMMLLFNFNHKEAVRSFRAAATLDANCAMAHWGEAFAHGPHINGPMTDDAVPLAWAALQRAQALKPKASARERAYIDALAAAVKALDNPMFPSNQVLAVARHLAHAGVAGARGENDAMIARLREAVAAEHALPYMEPAYWIYPTRQTLGAALLRLGRGAEAEAEFRADLAEFPRNGWGLFGLAESLKQQGKADAAALVQREFAEAWKMSDVTLQLEWL